MRRSKKVEKDLRLSDSALKFIVAHLMLTGLLESLGILRSDAQRSSKQFEHPTAENM